MTGEYLLLYFKEGKCFITAEKTLELEKIDVLANYDTGEIKQGIAWKVQIARLDKNNRKLYCHFISIESARINFPSYNEAQLEILAAIESISIPNIDTHWLLKTFKILKPNFNYKEPIPPAYKDFDSYVAPMHQPVRKPVKSFKTETFSISMKDIQFYNGCVLLRKKFKWVSQEVEFIINNNFLKEEHDAIKNYFAKILNANKISINATLELEDNIVVGHKAQSPEVERINETLIEEVKINFTKSIIDKTADKPKNLFSMEEFIAEFGEETFKPKIFYPDEKSFIDSLLKVSDRKHYKHLEYLSSIHCHSIMKLRFIPKPLSFIFLLETTDSFVFLWETLDTAEATYIWETPKEVKQLKDEIVKLDEVLTLIKTEGKNQYIASNPNSFHRIFHDYSNTTNNFDKWKNDLQKALNSILP
ncbi:hypothetical protein [Pinibacter aurantiacus]|uniref:Uncharacterized protein n=1 Tax=Pinibacter aurantiacus TaxID=2851599 RepID=A0A9E2S9M3_9BACT|nr:hypothetical protein [Pinibacter aurantiacus]MBV4357307.1 hypothetical protein [Pinibacter aurantiacus]